MLPPPGIEPRFCGCQFRVPLPLQIKLFRLQGDWYCKTARWQHLFYLAWRSGKVIHDSDWPRWLLNWPLISGKGGKCSLPHSVQLSSGAHTVSYRMLISGNFPLRKRTDFEPDHFHPSSKESLIETGVIFLLTYLLFLAQHAYIIN